MFIVLNLIGVSISVVMDKIIMQSINVYTMMFWYFFLTMIFYGITVIFKRDGADIKAVFKNAWLWVFLSAALFFAGNFLYFLALTVPRVLVSIVILIRRLSLFIATFLGGELFKEKHI